MAATGAKGAEYQKALPAIDQENRPYFEALERGELYFQRCHECGAIQFHPRGVCSNCLGSRLAWVRASGRATVYSFAVTQVNRAAGFRDSLPYVIAYVELEEGLRMLTNIIDYPPQAVRIGMAVEAVFQRLTPEVSEVFFRPAS